MPKERPLPRVDDKGILDMHVHIGPEFIRRRYNAATLAQEARSEGLEITDSSGHVTQGLTRALEMIAEKDLVLASGHLTRDETSLLVKTAHAVGIRRMVLTHPLWPGTRMSTELANELHQEYGAYT